MALDFHIVSIKKGFYQFVFPSLNGEHDLHGQKMHITVIEDGDRALIIDTGYPELAEIVKDTLNSRGIRLDTVILSHYHPDHVSGAFVFEGSRILAHPAYKRSYDFYLETFPEQRYIEPTETISEGDELRFGEFHIRFIETPGHSPCSLTTVIDEQYVHVSDLIAFAGCKLCVPFLASGGDFGSFIQSLGRIQALDPMLVLPAHGGPLGGKTTLNRAVEDSVNYIERMIETGGKAPIEDLLPGGPEYYAGLFAHEKNLKRMGNSQEPR